jgi:hypothetical protein
VALTGVIFHHKYHVKTHIQISLTISSAASETVSYQCGLIAIQAILAAAPAAAQAHTIHKFTHIAGNANIGTAIATAITKTNFHQVFKFSIFESLIHKSPAQLIS